MTCFDKVVNWHKGGLNILARFIPCVTFQLQFYCYPSIVPMDLDVKMKAVMMGACFLIVSVTSSSVLTTHQYLCSLQDFMFFERQQNN